MNQKIQRSKEIWYFSGTGQGEFLAREIQKRSMEYSICNITSEVIRCSMNKVVKNKDIILIYPVYASTVPKPLQQFFQQLKSENSNVVLIVLWGNAHNAYGVSCAKRNLSGGGFHIVGAAEVVAQHSCLINRGTSVFTKERIEEIVRYIKISFERNKEIEAEPHKESIFTRILCSIPNSGTIKFVTDMEFNAEKCKNCNACIRICPTHARILPNTVVEKLCIRCFGCETVCNQNAIHIHVNKFAMYALKQHQKVIHKDQFIE